MHPIVFRPPARKWYYVVWGTYQHRQLFKIRGVATFCERALWRACAARQWTLDAAYLAPHRVHLLVQVPRDTARRTVVRALQRALAATLRHAGRVSFWDRRLWARSSWCAGVGHGSAVSAVRHFLHARHRRAHRRRLHHRTVSTPAATGPR